MSVAKSYRRFKDILNEVGYKPCNLATVVTKVKEIQKLNQLLHQALRKTLADIATKTKLINHCQVANLEHQQLTVVVDSCALATKFRYQVPQLLAQLKNQTPLKNLETIIITTSPNISTDRQVQKNPWHKPTLSLENAILLKRTACHVKDRELQQALERLANNYHSTP